MYNAPFARTIFREVIFFLTWLAPNNFILNEKYTRQQFLLDKLPIGRGRSRTNTAKMLRIWVIQLHIIRRAWNIDYAFDGSEIEVKDIFCILQILSVERLWSSKHAKLYVIAVFAGSCPQIALQFTNYSMFNFPQDSYFYKLV